MTTEVDILSRLLPDLQASLDVPRVSHFLQSEGLLTTDECRNIVGTTGRSQAVESLVALVQQRRHADCARILLTALRATTSSSCQPNIVGNLERELLTRGSLSLPLIGLPGMQAAAQVTAGVGSMASYPESHPSGFTFNTQRGSLSKKDIRKMERMNCKLNKEIQKLQKNYKEFHHSIRKKLGSKRVSFGNVQSSVQYLPCFKNVTDPQHVLGHNTAIGRAKNVRDLFAALLAYTSWYNYQLIAHLVITYGGKCGRSLVRSYEARLQEHLERPLSQCPPFWPSAEGDAPSCPEVPEGFATMEVMLRRSYEACVLRDMNILRNALSNLLQLHHEALVLGAVQPGEEGQCCTTWMIPSVAVQHTINIAITRMVQLGTSQILQLRIGSTTVAPSSGQLPSQPGSSCFSSGPQRSISVDSTFTDGIGMTTASANNGSIRADCQSQHKGTLQRPALDSGRGTISPTTPQLSVNEEAYPDATYSSLGGHGGRKGSGSFSPRPHPGQITAINCLEPHQSRTGNDSIAGTTLSHGGKLLNDAGMVWGGGKVMSLPRANHTRSTLAHNNIHSGTAPGCGISMEGTDCTNAETFTFGFLGSGSSSHSVSIPTPTAGHPSQKPHMLTSKAQQLQVPCQQSMAALHLKPTFLSIKPESSEEDDSLPPPLPTPTTHTPPISTPLCLPPPSLLSPSAPWLKVPGTSDLVPPPTMFSLGSPVPEDMQLSGPYDSLQPVCSDTPGTLHRVRSESIFDEGSQSRLTTPVHTSFCEPQCEVKFPLSVLSHEVRSPRNTASPYGGRSLPQSTATPQEVKSPPQSTASPQVKSPPQSIASPQVKSPPQSTASPQEVKSPPQSAASRPTCFAISDIGKLLDSSNCERDTPSWETIGGTSPHLPFPVVNEHTAFKSQRKTSSFLWRVLARASEQCPANVFVVTISSSSNGDLKVGKGQKLMALHKIREQVYARDCHGNKGFVPYHMCRLSLKHYRHTKARKLAHTNLYLQSADGVDDCSRNRPHSESLPVIRMVAIQGHKAQHPGTLSASVGDKLRALYCDEQWVYAVNQTGQAGFLPRTACRLTTKGQEMFKDWILPQMLFQSDFVIKFNEPVPDILSRKQAVTLPTFKQGEFVVIEDRYMSEDGTAEPIFLKKGLRVRLLEAKDNRLRVTTGPGVSCWVPVQFCTPCRSGRPSSVHSRSQSPVSRSRTASPFSSPLHAAAQPVPRPQAVARPRPYVRLHQPTSMAQRDAPAASRGSLHCAAMDSATSRGSLHCAAMDSATSRGSQHCATMDSATSRGSLHYAAMDSATSRGSLHLEAERIHLQAQRPAASHAPSSSRQRIKVSPDPVGELASSTCLRAKILPPPFHNGVSPRNTVLSVPHIIGTTSPFTSNSRLYPVPLNEVSCDDSNRRASYGIPQNGMSPILPSKRLSVRNGISPDPYSKRASPLPLRNGISPNPYSKRASPLPLRNGISPNPYSKRASPLPLRNGISPDPYSKRVSPLPQWSGMTPGVSPTHSGVYHYRDASNRRSWGALSSGSRGGLSIGSRGDNSRCSPQKSESFI